MRLCTLIGACALIRTNTVYQEQTKHQISTGLVHIKGLNSQSCAEDRNRRRVTKQICLRIFFPAWCLCWDCMDSCPKVIKRFSCTAQVGLKFILLINVKVPTIGILAFTAEKNLCILHGHVFQMNNCRGKRYAIPATQISFW